MGLRVRFFSPVGALGALAAVVACDAPPRAEVVLSIDVDMPLASQLDGSTSADAVVDTLRVEVLGSDKHWVDHRTFSLSSVEELPISFGIPASVATDSSVFVRVRAFRAALASPGQLSDDPVLDPRPEATVDRLVTVALPSSGVVRKSLTLSGDCIGVRPRFGGAGQADETCLDGAHPSGLATDGLTDTPATKPTSVAGSWALAKDAPCKNTAPAGTLCIPGGLSILGDPLFVAVSEFQYDALPLRVAVVSPFFMDETEVTVGQVRDLVAAGYSGPLPDAKGTTGSDVFCTWDPTSSGSLPVNCVDYATASGICARKGGRLPREAEWERAARGRGERRLYAWGNDSPTCCDSSIGRIGGGGCMGSGPEAVGLHGASSACSGDVSRDGVLDLVGSVAELVEDSIALYSDPCWKPQEGTGILRDPVCHAAAGRIARGAAWSMALGDAPAPIRRSFSESDSGYGFRCVYEDP